MVVSLTVMCNTCKSSFITETCQCATTCIKLLFTHFIIQHEIFLMWFLFCMQCVDSLSPSLPLREHRAAVCARTGPNALNALVPRASDLVLCFVKTEPIMWKNGKTDFKWLLYVYFVTVYFVIPCIVVWLICVNVSLCLCIKIGGLLPLFCLTVWYRKGQTESGDQLLSWTKVLDQLTDWHFLPQSITENLISKENYFQ